MSCSTVRLRSLNFVRRKTTVLDEWLLVSTLSYPAVGPQPLNFVRRLTESALSFSVVIPSPGDVVTRVTTLLLMTGSLAPLPLVCGDQATTFGFRQMEDDSSWRLIYRFCCLSLKMEVKDKSLLLFTKWFMTLLSLQKFSDLDFS